MIKKINIAVVILFFAMLLVKMIVSLGGGSASKGVVTPIAPEGSQLEPTVYYPWWPPYFAEDVVAKRDGMVLDQIKAIFPRARFVGTGDYGVTNNEKLRADRRGVTFYVREAEDVSGFVASTNALATFVIRISTLRSCPWKYTGPDSIRDIKLYVPAVVSTVPFVKDLIDRGVGRIADANENVDGKLLSGQMDGYVDCAAMYKASDGTDGHSFAYEEFHFSPPLAKSDLIVLVNAADPEFAEAFIRDFDAGLERIRANGQLRRIKEYYGL